MTYSSRELPAPTRDAYCDAIDAGRKAYGQVFSFC